MKINRKLILLLVFAMIIGILVGCGKKAPEGVSQAFYDDMVSISSSLGKIIKSAKNADIINGDILNSEGYNKILEHLEDTTDLTFTESMILTSLEDIYFKSAEYHYYLKEYDMANPHFKDGIIESVETFSKLMDVKIDTNKIILK